MRSFKLDRVLDASPEELDQHRLALKVARQNRLEMIARTTEALMARMDAAATAASAKVLLHPVSARAVVDSSNHVAVGVVDFHGRLGIERSRESVESKRWAVAAAEARDKAIETGVGGMGAAGRLGTETFNRARSTSDKFASKLADRALRRRGEDEGRNEDAVR